MNLNDIFERRSSFFLTPSSTMKGAMMASLLIGFIALIYGFVSGAGTQVWGAILFNLFFFFTLGLGGLAFGAMQDLIGANWARPIKRLHEGFGAFVPVAAVLFVIFLVAVLMDLGGAKSVYSWIKDPSIVEHFPGKNVWLQPTFMVVRDVIALAIIVWLAIWQYRQTLPRDLKLIAGDRDGALRLGEESKARLRHWCAPTLVLYGVLFSLLAFDLIMSLAPTWYSTLWGGWLFAIMMQTLMASILIVMFSLKNSSIGTVFARQQFHDVGKLMHGFTVFFAYLTYAHILTYWYGNMPEETEYFIHRLHAPWIYIVIGVPIFAFLIPLYAMIPKASKWTASVAVPMTIMILVAQWYTFLLLVMPAVVSTENWKFPVIEIGVFLGFLGLFLTTYFWFGKRFPMVSIADPLLVKALHADHH